MGMSRTVRKTLKGLIRTRWELKMKNQKRKEMSKTFPRRSCWMVT